ncbi:hypothetical protein DdX_01414 [Ditylenchus destructor]|uniref:Uncharacterized protein n=1 Tax=Ditylenchus destructor TaxID=166010 RepID=A0AAD4NGS3_9BILA|nr:hypothetical protein DdX_01414 [Ditylenchus destructor]
MAGSAEDQPNGSSQIPKRYLRHKDALGKILDDHANDILPNWNLEDLSALLTQITRFKCDRNGIERFATMFQNTSADDILDAVNQLRDVNQQATASRFTQNAVRENGETEHETKNQFEDWISVVAFANKSRKIADDSSLLMPKVLREIPEIVDKEIVDRKPTSNDDDIIEENERPNYKKIYQYVGDLLTSRSLHKATSLEAAVILDVFNEMEEDVEKFQEPRDFFRNMFSDIQSFDPQDFKCIGSMDKETIGKIAINLLTLPDSVLDLSSFVPEPEK